MNAPLLRVFLLVVFSVTSPLIPSVWAQTGRLFGERPSTELVVKSFSDREIAALTTKVDDLLAGEKDRGKWVQHADGVLWNFVRELQGGRLTSAQETRVLAHLDGLDRSHPDAAAALTKPRFMIRSLTVGKTAPDIVGKDLDGADLRLSDYRGKVVVLLFSSEWCAICRTLYPYERLMQELYRNWPFAMLSVETVSNPAVARQAKAEAKLAYRSFWDDPGDEDTGAVASRWNVRGFPTLYVLDRRGMIRFVDLRYEDLLKGVRQLLMESGG